VKRVLVTGAIGFVGRVLSESLLADGYEVFGADREAADEPVETEVCDLESRGEVEALLDAISPEWIVHLAAQSSAGRSFAEPHSTIRNNVLPALHLVEYLRENNSTARLLAVGSADVYGPVTPDALPIVESQPPNPVNPYALSKWMQEETCRQYATTYDVDVILPRSFNHTGGGQSDTFVLSSFARQVTEIRLGQRDNHVRVGNIEVTRDFSDVRDICSAYRSLLEKGKRGVIYNVCSGESYSLRQLLEKLAELADVDIRIEVDPDRVRPADMKELCGDNSLIRKDTGWKPEIPIEETLKSLLDYWSDEVG
jgi:GDP-4-dehydro-6-deoxy-D-mannose reductase